MSNRATLTQPKKTNKSAEKEPVIDYSICSGCGDGADCIQHDVSPGTPQCRRGTRLGGLARLTQVTETRGH